MLTVDLLGERQAGMKVVLYAVTNFGFLNFPGKEAPKFSDATNVYK